MANVILYKEIITRSGRNAGGLRAPFRSMRASLAGVKVTVDGQQHHLRSTVPHSIGLAPGRHEFIAAGHGFARAVEQVDVAHDHLIVAISPDYTVSVSPETPLGSLRIHPVERFEELQPYRFYQGQPTSYFRQSVVLALGVSMVLSLACILAGLACLALLVVFGFIARDWRVGIILTLLVSLPALFLAPRGPRWLGYGLSVHEAACKLAGTSDFISGGVAHMCRTGLRTRASTKQRSRAAGGRRSGPLRAAS